LSRQAGARLPARLGVPRTRSLVISAGPAELRAWWIRQVPPSSSRRRVIDRRPRVQPGHVVPDPGRSCWIHRRRCGFGPPA
jgi:hypothetical protein